MSEPKIMNLNDFFPAEKIDSRPIYFWALNARRSMVELYEQVAAISNVETKIITEKDCRGDFLSALKIMNVAEGAIHVFSGYMTSELVRKLMLVAGARRQKVVVYDDAPIENEIGFAAFLKRLSYDLFLKSKVSCAVRAADLFITASGEKNLERLIALGWEKEKIVPFGRFPAPLTGERESAVAEKKPNSLRVLHLGRESANRNLSFVVKAARLAQVELVRSGGWMGESDLLRVIRSSDVVVAAGVNEPWGERINTALLEGVPVIVSGGMGSAILCKEFGCGLVFPEKNLAALASAFRHLADDDEAYKKLKAGAETAKTALLPQNRAAFFLETIRG